MLDQQEFLPSLCGTLEETQRRKCPDYKLDKLSAVDSVAFSVCHTSKTKQNTDAAIKYVSSVCVSLQHIFSHTYKVAII